MGPPPKYRASGSGSGEERGRHRTEVARDEEGSPIIKNAKPGVVCRYYLMGTCNAKSCRFEHPVGREGELRKDKGNTSQVATPQQRPQISGRSEESEDGVAMENDEVFEEEGERSPDHGRRRVRLVSEGEENERRVKVSRTSTHRTMSSDDDGRDAEARKGYKRSKESDKTPYRAKSRSRTKRGREHDEYSSERRVRERRDDKEEREYEVYRPKLVKKSGNASRDSVNVVQRTRQDPEEKRRSKGSQKEEIHAASSNATSRDAQRRISTSRRERVRSRSPRRDRSMTRSRSRSRMSSVDRLRSRSKSKSVRRRTETPSSSERSKSSDSSISRSPQSTRRSPSSDHQRMRRSRSRSGTQTSRSRSPSQRSWRRERSRENPPKISWSTRKKKSPRK